MALTIPEAAFQQQVIQLARLRGWRVFHARKAQNSRGDWRTPVAADGKGFPDLVLVRDRVIFAELKTDTGRIMASQIAWHEALEDAGAIVRVWRPRDWDQIAEALA
jgi:hypothetical protein